MSHTAFQAFDIYTVQSIVFNTESTPAVPSLVVHMSLATGPYCTEFSNTLTEQAVPQDRQGSHIG